MRKLHGEFALRIGGLPIFLTDLLFDRTPRARSSEQLDTKARYGPA